MFAIELVFKTSMNLYLRLLWTFIRCLRASAIRPGDTIYRPLRVLPNDLDINGHMNNGRYLTIVDLLLIEYFMRCGFVKTMVKRGWRPMSGGCFITYRRGLQPFQAYRVNFAMAASDESWNYMRFEFVRADGALCAAGYFKGAVVGKQGLVPNATSYAAMNHAFVPAPLPAAVAHWLAAESSVMALPPLDAAV
jgi:acyl-CoA thioesterase FadM